jgi:hypothetical protein
MNILVSTTLIIVLISTIVLGGLMSAFAKLMGLDTETAASGNDSIFKISQIEKSRTKSEVERYKKKNRC